MSCKSDEEFCHRHSYVIRHFVVTERKLGVLYVYLLYLLVPDSLVVKSEIIHIHELSCNVAVINRRLWADISTKEYKINTSHLHIQC